MARLTALFVIVALLLSTVRAQVDTSSWRWDHYIGLSHWNVQYSEDDTACGNQPPITTGSYVMDMNSNLANASVVDEHGTVNGVFSSGNVLDINERTVTDNQDQSTTRIYSYFLLFTTDCSSFAGQYKWDYSDQAISCSGTTKLTGTNLGSGCPAPAPPYCISSLDCNTTSSCVNGICVASSTQNVCNTDSDCNSGNVCSNGACVPGPAPAPPPVPLPAQLDTARQALNNDLLLHQLMDTYIDQMENTYGSYPSDYYAAKGLLSQRETIQGQMNNLQQEIDAADANVEAKYQAILATDPNNAQANWDMAELRKSQGRYDDYKTYMARALGQITDSQAAQVQQDVQSNLGLQTRPSPDTSKVEQQLGTEVREIKSINGQDMSQLTKEQRDNAMFGLLVMSLLDRDGNVIGSLNIQFK